MTRQLRAAEISDIIKSRIEKFGIKAEERTEGLVGKTSRII